MFSKPFKTLLKAWNIGASNQEPQPSVNSTIHIAELEPRVRVQIILRTLQGFQEELQGTFVAESHRYEDAPLKIDDPGKAEEFAAMMEDIFNLDKWTDQRADLVVRDMQKIIDKMPDEMRQTAFERSDGKLVTPGTLMFEARSEASRRKTHSTGPNKSAQNKHAPLVDEPIMEHQ